MTLLPEVAKRIIIKLLNAEDYRTEIFAIINNEFFNYSLNLLKELKEKKAISLNENWYRENFLDSSLNKDEIAINAGLNMKSISNAYNTTKKEVVIEASNNNYEIINELINELTVIEDINITLQINDSESDENISLNTFEAMLAINNMAVKRAAISGGAWSTAGKRVEKPLMQTLCLLYGVNQSNYSITYRGTEAQFDGNFEREIDFYLINDNNHFKCEVKLMGNGNPESADAVIAREMER
uniref:CfrBI family restriction endonuclease n=1 Tax=Aliarcobacter sp. TaxID=2321116 RepID=UPI004047A16E